MPEIPPIIVGSLVWFEHVRDRVKTLREEWKELDPPSQQALRDTAFRESVKWEIPERFLQGLPTPKDRLEKKGIEVPKKRPEKPQVEPLK